MADTLKEWADAGKLSQAKLSSDGTSLSLEGGGSTLDATQVIEATAEGKTCRYSLASIYLQVLDPNQGLMTYRNACKAHGVKDIVKPLDKPTVVSYFVGADAAAQAVPEKVPSPSSTTKHHSKRKERSSSKHRDKHRSSHKRSHRESSTTSSVEKKSVEKKKKKPKAPMTNEQLFSNLNVVVDKRAATEQSSQEEIHKALSAEGFDVTPELLQQHIASLDLILPLEIPVGNSASILRPATAVDRDFTRVLDLYNETIKPPTSSKHKSKQQQQHKTKSASSQRSADRAHLIGKKPVIVLPKGMSSPITIEMLAKRRSKNHPRHLLGKWPLVWAEESWSMKLWTILLPNLEKMRRNGNVLWQSLLSVHRGSLPTGRVNTRSRFTCLEGRMDSILEWKVINFQRMLRDGLFAREC